MTTKLLATALLAATLIPAAAQAQDWHHPRPGWDDHRYNHDDWRAWRGQHPEYYRAGAWNAPFPYRAFGVGMAVPRDYWGPRYTVTNWGTYRLPRPAYAHYRYIRHYNDVLLINGHTGRVVEVYRGFYR